MKNVIVLSGAAGFVGKKLASRLVELNFKVIALDLVNPEIQEVDFYYFDIAQNLDLLKLAIPEGSIFVHLAALSTDPICRENPIDAVNINVTGTARIVELVNRFNFSRLIFASSEWVYPEKQDSISQTESDSLRLENLDSLYAITKLIGENIVRTTCSVPNISLRFGIVYGPRTKPGSAPESIAHKISLGEHVTLGAGGTARRFIFVDDLIEGIYRAIIGVLPSQSCIYNLSGSELVNLKQIADISKDITKQRVDVTDARGIPSIRNPDPSNFMKDFDFNPKFSLSDGLKACLIQMK